MSDLKNQLQLTLGDGYTLEKELEGGGMSRVFVARDQQLGRRVVVKTLADDSGVSVSAERFRREIRLAASLQQANIVPVHSAGDVAGVPYYTMPFVEGESLRAHMDKRGALDVREAVNILRDVARALAFAHERGVVHRDIKPENILLSGSTAVVTDFGIAKAIEASHSQAGTTLTQLGTLLGTPAYISPEQAAGDPHVDHLADIYSLGVVAYEMLAGARPFTATAARALLAAHVNESPPQIATKREGLPPRLASLVMRCLEKEPERRPQKAGELLDALEGALAAGAVPAADAVPSIAVLPFANLSPDPSDEFFADGLTDEIITDLAGIRSLRVIARAAMMRFKGTQKEPGQLARELRVRYVLDGSVRRAGDSMRLTARLLDTESDATIWSDKLSGKVEDVFEMQERVSRTIVSALKVTLSPREERRLSERPFEDLQAYEAFLQAKQAMWSFGPASLARSRELIQFALSRIGENPALVSALGFIAIHLISAGGADIAAEAAAADECARKLARLAPDSFGRYALEGLLHWRKGEIREAIATLSAAHEREPSNVDAVTYLEYSYLMAGRDDRAREVSKLVVALDPITPLMQVMPAFCDLMTGRAREVLDKYAEFASREPLNPLAQFWLLCIRAEAGDLPGMRECAADIHSRWPGMEFGLAAKITLDLLDHPERAATLAVPPSLRTLSAEGESISRSLAWLFGRLGAHEAALDALEDCVARGLAHYPHLARDSQSLAGVRAHPRFQRLLATVRERWERGGTAAEDLVSARAATVASAPKPVIAVLPLTNMSASADDEYFADGMTEDIIAQLSRIASLSVIARASVMRFKGASKRPREVGNDLGATHIVDGSVRRAGSRLRIVAQLIDTRTEMTLWSETFDRELTDVFAIQADVADRIAAALQTRLTVAERGRITKAPTKNLAAYEAYLRGRQTYHSPPAEKIGFSTAAAHFEQAIALDGDFAQAHAALAWIHSIWAQGYWGASPRDAWARASDLAQRALALDPECGEAHLTLAVHAATFRFAWSDALRLGERAIEIEPSNATVRANVAYIQSMCGMTAEAIASARRAHELDPLSPSVRFEPFVLLLARRFGEALAGYEELERLAPGTFFVTIWHAITLVALNRHEEALALLRDRADGYSDNWSKLTTAALFAACGDAPAARSRLAKLHAQEETEYVWPIGFAMAYAHLGEFDRAFRYLDKAFEDRCGWITFLPSGMFFDPLRGDPRLDALIRKVSAPVEPTTYRPPARAASKQSVAILPFANLSPDPENEFFADGITDDLIAQVAKIGSLRVIARTSVVKFRGVQDAARTAAKELGVSAVVEGTVRRAGKRARIVAQLIDSSSGAPIWSETYDRDLDDVFTVQTEVATNVASALKIKLTPAEERRIARAPTNDAKAYDLYLVGRHLFNRRTPESLRSAIAQFEQAIERDPGFAAAHAGLADAHVFAGLGYAPVPILEAFASAKAAADRALALDESSPEAHCAMGLSTMHGDWDIVRARAAFERAIALNPSHAAAHQMLGWCTFGFGEYAAALEPLGRARELDPLNVSLVVEEAWPYMYGGLHGIGLDLCRRAVTLDSGFGLGHYNVGNCLEALGRHAEALACFERAVECMGPSPWMLASIGTVSISLGDPSRAREVLATLDEQGRAGVAVWLSIAIVRDALGEAEPALKALERSIETHEPFVWALGLENWLKFPNARKLPGFQRLYERTGSKPHDIPRQRELLLAHAKQKGLA
jgi:TolB-like protein/Tfp pilus assembly protein PilF